MKNSRAWIGTSGWSYDHWNGVFYPEDLPASERLAYYCRHFDTVEINNSFYHLPEADTLAQWRESVPAGFVFAAKASRYLTHMKKLKDADRHLPVFLDRMASLGKKLGPVLFQLPPRWHYNHERLQAFLDALPQGHRHALEFRDPSWINPQSQALLTRHNVAFCIYHLAGYQSPLTVTADFVYIRLHGPDGAYAGSYSRQRLKTWAGRIRQWRDEGRDVYCYFDNDESGYAVANALQLRKMIND